MITLGATIPLKVHEDLLKNIDDVARSFNLTMSEWIRSTLAHAVKKEMAQAKISIDVKLVIDTSVLVSIETVNLVSKVMEYFDIPISDTVRIELSEKADYLVTGAG